ncbi:DinB family protein [Flavobacterium hungaricum]|uniref:Damage-inducible protein DinB n=1 Tax=Flavobacterium hungaricum TaxID=2082725 RepID=A0ABR9TK87_9FLAO|nr:DinB family protein [Flavobacterium hungaricum]MBE8725773.1 damage-inducible protein DinB [Flavobacterium hungaricum]
MYLQKQYNLVLESRNVLFDYCKTIKKQDFKNENSSFGRGGSMRNLLVHIANTYEFWIANISLKKNIVFSPYENYQNIEDVIKLFLSIDELMDDFFELTEKSDNEIQYERNGQKTKTEPFKIFTHVITHEYHHKGQILSLSRHLGYIPVDTDIIR